MDQFNGRKRTAGLWVTIDYAALDKVGVGQVDTDLMNSENPSESCVPENDIRSANDVVLTALESQKSEYTAEQLESMQVLGISRDDENFLALDTTIVFLNVFSCKDW